MKKITKALFLLVIVFTCFFNNKILAESISAKVSADTNNVLLGDRIILELSAEADSSLKIFWPEITDKIDKIEILDRTSIDTVLKGTLRTLTQHFSITSFDTGTYEIPAIVFMYEKPGFETLYPAETNPLYLTFYTVQVDTSKEIKDIKGPMQEPFSILEYIWEIIIGLLILGVIITGIYYWMHKKPKDIISLDYDPKIPPHVLALESLNKLDNEKLWQKGQIKKYHSILTEIIRLYIERSFEVKALEMTSNEIITGMGQTGIPVELIAKLVRILSIADQVKFAKVVPLPDENSESINHAVVFVKATLPVNVRKEEDAEANTEEMA